MKRAGKIAALCALLAGCAGPGKYAVLHAPAANLALGPTAEHVRLGEAFAYRSAWPSVDAGYRFEDTSFFSQVIFDDQSFYDRLGGGLYHETQTVRTGIMVR